MLSILIPTFNEQNAIKETVSRIHQAFSPTGEIFEILVIDDGSTDRTPDILRSLEFPELQVFAHQKNRGYGSSMKTGIRKARGDIIATTDADGTYPLEEIPNLLKIFREKKADMVVGARTKQGVQIPLIRKPAKWIVGWLANTLVRQRIPDLNSGMRLFRKSLAEEFFHLYPRRFSFTITITLAALTNDYAVEFVPINYHKRIGRSTLSTGVNGFRNFVNFLGLIVRIVTYFCPLKFFAWPSLLLMFMGSSTILFTIWTSTNISDAGLLLLLAGLQVGLFGLLADIVVRNRRSLSARV